MTLSNAQRVNQETQIFTKESWHMGLDIGSTTIKLVLFHGEDLIYQTYRRHNSDIKGILLETFREVEQAAPGIELQLSITGSGGVLVAEWLDIPFVQEVIAETKAIQRMNPEADVIIELGEIGRAHV